MNKIFNPAYQCLGKKKFSKARAKNVKRLMTRRYGTKFVYYPCPHCHLYHVGHDRSHLHDDT